MGKQKHTPVMVPDDIRKDLSPAGLKWLLAQIAEYQKAGQVPPLSILFDAAKTL